VDPGRGDREWRRKGNGKRVRLLPTGGHLDASIDGLMAEA
jgi:hypothetical protein